MRFRLRRLLRAHFALPLKALKSSHVKSARTLSGKLFFLSISLSLFLVDVSLRRPYWCWRERWIDRPSGSPISADIFSTIESDCFSRRAAAEATLLHRDRTVIDRSYQRRLPMPTKINFINASVKICYSRGDTKTPKSPWHWPCAAPASLS